MCPWYRPGLAAGPAGTLRTGVIVYIERTHREGGAVDIRLLGGIEVHDQGRRLDIGQRRERGLLALLALEMGTVLSLDRLASVLWDGDPPGGYREAIYVHMSRLRGRIDSGNGLQLLTRRGGYCADGDPQLVDAHRFRSLLDRARSQTEPARKAPLLSEGLGLWRGPALADALSDPARERVTAYLTELRRSATEELYEAELERGRYREIIADLSAALAEHWPNDRLTAQLMQALHRTGRQTDALAVYRTHRIRLANEYGTDPGSALQRIHEEILRGEPAAGEPPTTTAPVPARQLPHPGHGFVGRATELGRLDEVLKRDTHTPPGAPTVVISGPAGVGKTTLCLHWAAQIADRFPDGQLYVNLRGYDSSPPLSPASALTGFIRALGGDSVAIPSDLDERAALYRTLLSHRQVLILLDNARSPDQIRPLLPGPGACLTLVTSRSTLAGLAVREGAARLPLDRLSTVDGIELLRRVLGSVRVDAEPEAAASLVDRCDRLPLALRVAAERVADHPGLSLASMAAELGDRAQRLHQLAVPGDPTATVTAVLSWSYRALDPGAARMWRLLGLHPVPELSLAAAASLLGVPGPVARSLLDTLVTEHIAQMDAVGRYRQHDLIHAYATERARTDLSTSERAAALWRLLDFYRHTAYAADRLVPPARPTIELGPVDSGTAGIAFPDTPSALSWLDTEHHTLLAVQDLAAQNGHDREAAQLALILDGYHRLRGYLLDNIRALRIGYAAAVRAMDPDLQARCQRDLGHAYGLTGQLDPAVEHLSAALATYRSGSDISGQAHVHEMLSCAYGRQRQDRAALGHAVRALRLFRVLDDPMWTAVALNGVGWFCAKLNHPRPAEALCEQALALYRVHGDRKGEANVLDALGFAAYQAGDHPRALASYRDALGAFRALGDRFSEAVVLHHIGDTYQASGSTGKARDAWREAVTLYQTQHRLVEARALLAVLD